MDSTSCGVINKTESTCVCGRGVRGLIQMFEQFSRNGLRTTKRPLEEKVPAKCVQCKKSTIPVLKARTLTLLVNGRPVARSIKHLPVDEP